ncbi:MAG: succinate dehydrogenase/fumarate reductase iron-sulfur subunit [Planctomycetota bacterium]|nr:succinate dehydrogenase/fumarate reductase iron-sulfur subunit [Planctomycetota bacterium]
MSDRTAKIRVTRFRPEEEDAPTEQTYEVPFKEDWVVLDALNYIKDYVDGTLSFRWSCRMGVCGSCGMMVNGTPKLTCSAFVRDYYPEEIVVEPLAHFPIIRDLVVEVDDFMDKLKAVKPWIIRKEEKPVEQGEYLQSVAQLDSYRQFSMCINCMLCYSACPVYGMDDTFIGPAAIALGYRYNLDSRDEGAAERTEVMHSHDGVWDCTFVGECSVVCPKHVDPAAAIQRSKVEATKEYFLSFLMPWKKK